MKNSKAILQVPGTMKIISAEIPVPKEDEVLIKVEYVGICGSDVHGFESGPFIPPKDPNQEIGLGHECAGTVVAGGKPCAQSLNRGSGKYRTWRSLRSLSLLSGRQI
ncbi:Sorbitol dehydrogenase [Shigella dysenteriae 1617]|uniref:Sorbitol dehydrogenase n=1 Tax=Shigella dysenteriae 1617 TaxID=754093 RepID=A0A0A6ZSF9_SHIDY|nr:Sorbitol dehydrogenase [Shigella dysenteriae 1617]